jgi:hypothetical protein
VRRERLLSEIRMCAERCTLQQLKMHMLYVYSTGTRMCTWLPSRLCLSGRSVFAVLCCGRCCCRCCCCCCAMLSSRVHFTVGAFSLHDICIMTKTSAVLCIALVSSQHVYARRGDVLSRARSTSVMLIFESELKHAVVAYRSCLLLYLQRTGTLALFGVGDSMSGRGAFKEMM